MEDVGSRLDLSYTVGSLHCTALALGVTAAGLAADRLIGRVGRRAALGLGVSGMGAGVLVLTFTGHVVLTIGVLLMGVFGGLMLSGAVAVLADAHPRHVSAALTEANVVSSALAVLALPATATAETGSSSITTGTAASRTHRLPRRYWGWWLLLVDAVEFSMTFWAATYLEDDTGLTRAAAASAVSLFLAGMLTGRVAGTRLTLRGISLGLCCGRRYCWAFSASSSTGSHPAPPSRSPDCSSPDWEWQPCGPSPWRSPFRLLLATPTPPPPAPPG